MDFIALANTDTFTYAIVPVLIFLARILDVSIGTIRIIFISRGYKLISPILGFFEVMIWLLAVRQIMLNISSPVIYIAYAAGFATGTFVGMVIEEKLSIGKAILRIITEKYTPDMLEELKDLAYSATSITEDVRGGQIKVIFAVVNRKEINHVVKTIRTHDPEAFYSIEDVRFATENHPHHPAAKKRHRFRLFRFGRKGK